MIGRLKIQGDKLWNVSVTDAETGQPLTPFYRAEYVTDLDTQEHYIKLWVRAQDVDLDITAPVEVIEAKPEGQSVVYAEPDIKKLAREVVQEMNRQARLAGLAYREHRAMAIGREPQS